MLIGQPLSGILVIVVVLFMALLGTILNTSLPAFLAIIALHCLGNEERPAAASFDAKPPPSR